MGQPKTKTKNKRYQKTEEVILEALMKSKEFPTTSMLIKKARIARSTLYRHHKTVLKILPDYERGVLIKYGNVVRRLIRRKNIQIRTICLRTLIFIMAEQELFKILLKYEGGIIIEKMILKLRSKLKAACHLPPNSDKILRVYAKEVAGIIEEWSDSGFKEDKINETLNKILYLTETMKQRLGPLNYLR